MVLLDDVVQVGGGPTPAALTQSPLLLQSAHRVGIREVTIHIDDARTRMIWRRQDVVEEVLRSRGVPLLSEIEVQRGTSGVHGPEQVHPASRDPNVGPIDSPGRARPSQLSPDSPVEFGNVALHPAPHRRVIDAQTAFRHQFFQVSIAKRKAEIPSDAEDDDFFSEVPAAKKRRPIDLHQGSISSPPSWVVCNTSLLCVTSSPLTPRCKEA